MNANANLAQHFRLMTHSLFLRQFQKMMRCVWLDERPTGSDEDLLAQGRMQSLCERLQTFDDRNQCVDFVSEYSKRTVVLSTSDDLARLLLLLIHSREQIHSIYLFDFHRGEDQRRTRDYPKIRSFVNDSHLASTYNLLWTIPSQLEDYEQQASQM